LQDSARSTVREEIQQKTMNLAGIRALQQIWYEQWARYGTATRVAKETAEREARANALSVAQFVEATLLRDIFGNPFRSVAVNPAWRTANVIALAQAIYDDRAFGRMPILGDALEDAGCDNGDILNHCRASGEHVRGCWVVDLLLGKS